VGNLFKFLILFIQTTSQLLWRVLKDNDGAVHSKHTGAPLMRNSLTV